MPSIKQSSEINLEEQRLVRLAAQGDFAAFESLVNLYRQPLWKFAYRMLGNNEDAADVVQQILFQFYRALPSLDDQTRFKAWLFTIARNKCLDWLRRRVKFSAAPFSGFAGGDDDDAVSPLELQDPAPLPEEWLERRETQRLLQDAIMTLPEKSRQVVALRYSTDLSFAEIGQALGLNENTVKTLFQRAKGQLRLIIRQEFKYEDR
jgi:RNA polymerase sigma-70 factor (ECF subfamily)